MDKTVKVFIILLIIIMAIIGIFYFLLAPGNDKKCIQHKWLYQSKIAHRGYYNNEKAIMENSKTAFQIAIEKGFNIEMDVSLTKDNQLIVYHDDDFNRLFHVNKKVSDLTLSEIQELKYENTEDRILSFPDFLEIISGKTGLLIELKSQSKERDIVLCQKVLEALKDYQGNYALQSFNPFIVRYLKKNCPMIPRGQLYTKFNLKEERKITKGQGFKGIVLLVGKFFYNHKLANCIGRPLFINHDFQKLDFFARLCHHFMPLIVYVINDVHYYDYCQKNLKADNIIFENLEINKDGRAKKNIS